MALKLDGVEYKGTMLKIRRPKDYKPGAQDPHYVPGVVSSIVQDSMFKVFIGGLPTYVSDEQVMDLLKAFGELKSFNLVKDTTGVSKGFAFCEFLLPEITDIACEGLHGLEVGDKKLIVQRASVGGAKLPMIDGALPGAGLGRPILPIEVLGANGLKPAEPTRVLLLLNMVKEADLEEDEDYDEILDDVRKECELFGTVVDVHIPRPNEDKEVYVPGIGKVIMSHVGFCQV
jgi:splicing factor U2AF 65 kDa subunit